MTSSKLYPQVREGWSGYAPFRAYKVTRNHGQHTISISMPENRFMGMSKGDRVSWLSNARHRAETNRP